MGQDKVFGRERREECYLQAHAEDCSCSHSEGMGEQLLTTSQVFISIVMVIVIQVHLVQIATVGFKWVTVVRKNIW